MPSSIDNLLSLYFTIARSYWFMGITARLALVVVLYLVWAGNKRPGNRLLSGVFAALFFLAGLMAFGGSGAVLGLSLSSLALAIAFGITSYRDDTQWNVAPREGVGLITVALLYLLALEFPFWGAVSTLFAIFFPPFGLLPQQTMLIVLLCLMMSGKKLPIYITLTSVIMAIAMALLDMLGGGNMIMGVTMFLYLALALARLVFDLAAGIEAPIKFDAPVKPARGGTEKTKEKKLIEKKPNIQAPKTVKKAAAKKKKKWDIN